MNQHLIAVHQAASYGTGGLKTWIQENAITLVILIAAVVALWAGKGGNIAKGISIAAGVLIGLTVLGLATGTNATDVANFIFGLFKN